MHISRSRRAALVGVLALAATGLVGAGQASGGEVAAYVTTYENSVVEPGTILLNWGFTPESIAVPSGSTVRWRHSGAIGEPHTVSVVNAADVPDTVDEVFDCRVCNDVLAAHDPGNDGAPPFKNAVNVGKSGLNTAGDSRLLVPGTPVYARVSAAPGRTLHYICAIHPWMQGTIRVL